MQEAFQSRVRAAEPGIGLSIFHDTFMTNQPTFLWGVNKAGIDSECFQGTAHCNGVFSSCHIPACGIIRYPFFYFASVSPALDLI